MDSTTSQAPRWVLDTNVTLDWLLFGDRRAAPIGAAIQAGRVAWLVTARMRAELEHVMQRAPLAQRRPDCEHILARFDQWGRESPGGMGSPRLRCRDADDQMFIDLAFDHRPSTLITHDRDLLTLARRAGACDVRIVRPGQLAALDGVGLPPLLAEPR